MSNAPPTSEAPRTAARRAPTSGIAAVVTGILGLSALPLIGAILALVFGYQSRREALERPDVYSDDLGRVGRILGWIGVVLSAIGLLGFVLALLLFL